MDLSKTVRKPLLGLIYFVIKMARVKLFKSAKKLEWIIQFFKLQFVESVKNNEKIATS